VTAHPTLNDIRSGFEGRPVAEYLAATAHNRLHARANGGESLLDYQARVLGFVDWLRTQPERVVLVVAHEETLRVFKAYFEGLGDEAMQNLVFGNCALCEFLIE